jgi:hypothetical protein
MVFEKLGNLRYHALWAYTAIVLPSVLLDKIPVENVEALAAILAPFALVITADIVKHRNDPPAA